MSDKLDLASEEIKAVAGGDPSRPWKSSQISQGRDRYLLVDREDSGRSRGIEEICPQIMFTDEILAAEVIQTGEGGTVRGGDPGW